MRCFQSTVQFCIQEKSPYGPHNFCFPEQQSSSIFIFSAWNKIVSKSWRIKPEIGKLAYNNSTNKGVNHPKLNYMITLSCHELMNNTSCNGQSVFDEVPEFQ